MAAGMRPFVPAVPAIVMSRCILENTEHSSMTPLPKLASSFRDRTPASKQNHGVDRTISFAVCDPLRRPDEPGMWPGWRSGASGAKRRRALPRLTGCRWFSGAAAWGVRSWFCGLEI